MLLLQDYAPTCIKLMDPPYEFAPYDAPTPCIPELLLTALQLEQPEPLTRTNTELTVVASHSLLLEFVALALKEYAPTYSALIAPP